MCDGCRPEHTAADCIDTEAGREHPWRHCCCQHQPRPGQVPPVDEPTSDQSDSNDQPDQGGANA